MHARVAQFENQSLSDDLVGIVRSRVESGEPPPGSLGMFMLVDHESGAGAGVSFFESEQAIEEAEPTFERMGDEIPEEIRGRRTSVDSYEVVHLDGEPGKAARLSSIQGSPDKVDEGARSTVEDILPDVRKMDGSTGAVLMVDRDSGRSVVITLWESEDALRSGEEQANKLRQQAAEGTGGEILDVKRFEVAVARMPAAVS